MNATIDYKMTIVVPVYNERDNMATVEQRLADYLAVASCHTCVLFVNDGSKDGSLELIEQACARHHDFYFISLGKNSGLSAAMKAGIDYTFSDYVAYIDADMQTAPEDFNLLLRHIDGNALVTGVRANRQDTPFKKLQSKIANSFRRMMTGDTARDTGCPLKIIHTDCAKRIPFFKGMHRFLPALVTLQGQTFAQVDVRHFPRVAGQSKYHLWNRLAGPFADCFAFRWMKKRYINYSVAQSNLDDKVKK